MPTEPTTSNAFAKRAQQWGDRAPLFAALCRTIADEPALAAPVDDGSAPAERQHGTVWSLPQRLFAVITQTLRTKASGHALADYWPTLGGVRPIDDDLVDAFRDFSSRHGDDATALASRLEQYRQNDPLVAATMWPGIAWAAAEIAAGPVALLELGAAAGVCLYSDRFGYRYDDRTIRADSALVLDCDFHGEVPEFARADVEVAARIGLEREPIRREDSEAIAWLRDCVLPDETGRLADLDNALSIVEVGGVDWRPGDYMDTLPEALVDVEPAVTPVVFGAHTLCCAQGPERLPQALQQANRDVVWIAKEHADNALGLISDAAADFATEDGEPSPVLLTLVHYRVNRPSSAWVLAEGGRFGTSLTWNPHEVSLR